jgi:hypothetical protein
VGLPAFDWVECVLSNPSFGDRPRLTGVSAKGSIWMLGMIGMIGMLFLFNNNNNNNNKQQLLIPAQKS